MLVAHELTIVVKEAFLSGLDSQLRLFNFAIAINSWSGQSGLNQRSRSCRAQIPATVARQQNSNDHSIMTRVWLNFFSSNGENDWNFSVFFVVVVILGMVAKQHVWNDHYPEGSQGSKLLLKLLWGQLKEHTERPQKSIVCIWRRKI